MHNLHTLTPRTPFQSHFLVLNHIKPRTTFSSSRHGIFRGFITLSSSSQRRRRRRAGRSSTERKWRVSALDEREASTFEVDQEKARQALDDLDQQLETLSRKQVNPPKIRASSMTTNLKEQMKDESAEVSGSFLAFLAFGLLAFTIFYNILFLTVIKPAIDGPDEIMTTDITTTSEAFSDRL